MKKLILIALALASTAALAQSPRAFLVASYLKNNGRTLVCEYSDGSRYDIAATSRCAAVLY